MKLPYKLFRKDGEWWVNCLGYEANLGAAAQGPMRRLKAKVPDEYENTIRKFVSDCEARKQKETHDKR